jgi:hypothetical protein
VVVAVTAVRVMQVTIDEIADMVAMGHRFMTATGAMLVVLLMAVATVRGCATVGIGRCDLDHMLIDMIAMDML